ncbi:hypothetical protein L5515_003050 [Caenorhabditis briggsae]|uniref:Protein CBR-DPY-1 n=1 Tax=Caenorhabditis briggsae TaxID=6238 RepID=A0AAE9JAZ6_CAEBR|nr:hypothetical protein L5515_003050 [Caenorhabditis briggsae]
MRRRRSPTIHINFLLGLIFPVLISSQTYDAIPIGRPFLRPPPSPRQENEPAPTLARGYQPPPRPSNFQPPRSYPNFQKPSLNLDNKNFNRQPQQFNWQMQQLQQQDPRRFQGPVQQQRIPQTPPSFLPARNHLRAGAPGQVPRVPNVPVQHFQGPQQLDPVNNIIIHLYLNAKDRMPSHTEIKTPVHGLFGIGTSHGGPGSHSDPIVITKDFDRETLEFVDEGQAKKLSGPSNIIEVKATVSTPNRQLENTVNHAVNQELDRAIPKVMDRMRGSTMTMDNGMRKELEEALVDELAKNLGETIDNTEITQEDLEKLIEEGFDEVQKGEEKTTTTSRPTPKLVTIPRTTTTQRPTTTVTPDFNNDDDYFTEDSEDISQTSRGTVPTVTPPTPPPTTTTTRTTTTARPTTRIIVTSTTRVWTTTTQAPPTTEAPTTTTEAPWARATSGHVHVMPGIRVTETSSPPTTTSTTTRTPTTRTTWTPPPTTTTATTTTTPPTTTTTSQTPPPTPKQTWAPWTPPTTTLPPYHPPTSVAIDSEEEFQNPGGPGFEIPTRKPLIEVSPSIGPTHHGIVNLESNEEDYESTVTSRPVAMFTTERSTVLHNLPTKPSSAPTLHPSTFSPPLVTATTTLQTTDTQEPFTFSLDTSTPSASTVTLEDMTTSTTQTSTVSLRRYTVEEKIEVTASTVTAEVTTTLPPHEDVNTSTASTVTPSTPQQPETSTVSLRRYTVEEKIEVTASTVTAEVTTTLPPHEDVNTSTASTVTPSTPQQPETSTVSLRRYTVEEKIEVHPHTIYTEEPFFSTSSIEWNPTTSAEDVATTTTTSPDSVIMREDEDYDYTNEFAIPLVTTTTTISTTTNDNQQHSSKPKMSSSEEIQPNFVIPSGQCPTPNQPNLDRNRTDILFLLDSSDNFNEQRFHRAIKLIGETVSKFNNFGSDGVQVSLVQYNDEPYLEFSLRKHNCKKHLLDDIADTEFMTGGSQLTKALEKVSQFAFTKKRGDRPDAENVLIIVTDGQSNGRIQEPTRLAKENNVTVLVITTIEADKQFVNELSGNRAENEFGLDGNNEDLSWKLAQRIASSSSASSGSSGPPGTNPISQEPKNSEILSPVLPDLDENSQELITRRPENTENSGIIDLECVGDGFKIQVNPPEGFKGVAVVKGYADDVRCKATARSSTPLNLFISNEECGVTQVKSSDPKGLNSSLVLHLLHENDLNTAEDRAYLLQCFIGSPPDEDAVLSTNLDVVRSELAIAETISLSTLPPTCTYSIRRDGPDGPIVNKAVVGQTVWHRWECDGTNETTQAYGIQIHSCYASDDVERKFAFVDPRGCSSDLALLTDLTYADDSLTAWAASHVFNVHDAESLKFVCKLSLCTRDGDGCEGVTPPSCGNTNKTGLLLTKRLTKGVNSVDEALTSALSTNVKLSSGSPDTLEDFIKSATSSSLFWVIAVIAVAAVVAISKLSRNIADSSETATTCSDPTISNAQDFGGSIRSISSPQPNPRLADFMRNFDRNRYV